MECFITDFLRFSGTNIKICLFGQRVTGHQIEAFHGVLNPSATRETTRTFNFW